MLNTLSIFNSVALKCNTMDSNQYITPKPIKKYEKEEDFLSQIGL
jgi:hypothetical protein